MVTATEEKRKQRHIIDEAIKGVPLDKIEADVKPSLHLDVKPSLHYIYSSANTHKEVKEDLHQRTLIFEDKNIRKGFAQVPNVVLRDSTLSGNEKTLYALLLSYAWQDKECFPGQDKLAEDMGLSRVSVNQMLSKLKNKKLIRIKRQGLGKVNIYHIRKLSDAYPQMVD